MRAMRALCLTERSYDSVPECGFVADTLVWR